MAAMNSKIRVRHIRCKCSLPRCECGCKRWIRLFSKRCVGKEHGATMSEMRFETTLNSDYESDGMTYFSTARFNSNTAFSNRMNSFRPTEFAIGSIRIANSRRIVNIFNIDDDGYDDDDDCEISSEQLFE